MVRAFKIKDEVCGRRGRGVASHAIGSGAALVKLGTLSLRYIVVDGKLYYNLQDFTARFRKNLEGRYEMYAHKINNVIVKTLNEFNGTGTIYALKRGMYCDTSFMAYVCEAMHFVDLKEDNRLFSVYPINLEDLETLRAIAGRNIADPPTPEVGVFFTADEFFEVVPHTVRCSGRGQIAELVNVPIYRNTEDTNNKGTDGGVVKPEEEQQEPIATPNIEENHPIDKDIIKAATSLNSGVKSKFIEGICNAVDATKQVADNSFTEALHGVETEVKSIIEALVKGKKLSISITVGIE